MSQAPHLKHSMREIVETLVRTLFASGNYKMTMAQAVEIVAHATGYAEDTVNRWRSGRLHISDSALTPMLRLGHAEAGLPRAWGERLLKAARYQFPENLLDEIWGPVEASSIPNNVPTPPHRNFVGREQELNTLLGLLSREYGVQIIVVAGRDGVGKTSLILEALQHCLHASIGGVPAGDVPKFEAIVFFDAKSQESGSGGSRRNPTAARALEQIFEAIAQVLERPAVTRGVFTGQDDRARDALGRQPTLLAIAHWEVIKDKEGVMRFLYHLPANVKVLLATSEPALGPYYAPIQLQALPEDEGMQMIRDAVEDKRNYIPKGLTETQVQILYERTGGNPAAIIYAVGQLADGRKFPETRALRQDSSGDAANFFFLRSVAPLRKTAAHLVLMAAAMLPTSPTRDTVTQIAGLSADLEASETAIARLSRLSLVWERNDRLVMSALTRDYVLDELASNDEFEWRARERLISWCIAFVSEHGGGDWRASPNGYLMLGQEWENLCYAMDWCVSYEHYQEGYALYSGISEFAKTHGYWSKSLDWLDWLSRISEQRGDWKVAVLAMCNRAWIYVNLGDSAHLSESEVLLGNAWTKRDHVDLQTQFTIAHHCAELCIRQGDFAAAHMWLDRSQELLDKAALARDLLLCGQCSVDYHRGIAHFHLGDFLEAVRCFELLRQKSIDLEWKRATAYADNWLADIALEACELERAAELLEAALDTARQSMDLRRTAFIMRSYTFLKHREGKLLQARRWGKKALDAFDRLGMKLEKSELAAFIERL